MSDSSEPEKKDWYNNKELFEMIQNLKDEMKETRNVIKKYNGIRKDLSGVMKRVQKMEERRAGRSEVGQAIKDWGGWIISLIVLFLYFYELGVF
ncbi:MAG: hypothetical protein ACLFT6_01815 [Bacteroidales bacterium]